MSKGRSISIKLGPYEFEIVRQKEGKQGDLYTTFPHSRSGLHLSVHKSGRMHLRGARDAETGRYETDLRLREEDSQQLDGLQIALDILENSFFTPSSYPRAISIEIPQDLYEIDSGGSKNPLRYDPATVGLQMMRSIRPLNDEQVLIQLNDRSNPRRIIAYDDPEAGFSILIPSHIPGERPIAFSQKWLMEKTRFGREYLKPMIEGIDKGIEMSQEGLNESISREVDGPTLERSLKELFENPATEEFLRLTSVYLNSAPDVPQQNKKNP